MIVPHCKLNNDASIDISQDGQLLAVLVPSPRGFPDDSIMAVFSLTEDTLSQCLYTKSFGTFLKPKDVREEIRSTFCVWFECK